VQITGGSALAKDDIERMMADAEKYAEEDRQRREEAEVRNRAESLAYTTEKFLSENADKVPDDIKSEVESAIADLKKTLEGTDTEAIKTASEHAAQVSQKMGTAIYAQSQAASASGAQAGPEDGQADASGDDDVVDAEIVEDERPGAEGGAA
jgi:molecular chaperone DnaK